MMPISSITAEPGRRARSWLLAGLALVYALVSLVNHYNFRTAAFDLGILAQAADHLAHGRAPRITQLLDAPPTNYLANHFSLTPALAAPLVYVVGPAWALLLLQLAAVLLGALGVWHYARAQGASYRAANWARALFGCQWGIFSALAVDYHDNVVGAMAVPWLALWVGRGRPWPALGAALLILLSKENMALWLAGLLLGLAWQHHAHRRRVVALALGAVGALGYYAVITRYVMPALDTTHRPFMQLVRYTHLGNSLPAVVANVLLHPRLLWAVLFQNTLPEASYDYIKLETWLALLVSGGWALWRRPWYLLMLAPILGQKLLASDYALWGINYQYSVEFAPVLALAVVDALRARSQPARPAPARAQRAWAWAVAGAAVFTLTTLYVRRSEWYDRAAYNFLQGRHYHTTYPDRAGLYAALGQVPAGVPLSTVSRLVPHLLNRRDIFLFPVLRSARLVLLPRAPSPDDSWPLPQAQLQAALPALRARPGYRVLYEDAQVVLLARPAPLAADTAEVWRSEPAPNSSAAGAQP